MQASETGDAPRPWELALDRCMFLARHEPGGLSCAAQISDILRHARAIGASSRDLCRMLAEAFRNEGHEDLLAALDAIAAAADASGQGNAYHNPEHSRAVGVGFINLARIHNRLARSDPARALSARAFLLGCCAAFGHDLLHDGKTNDVEDAAGRRLVPFRLESRAADEVAGHLGRHGAPALETALVRCAIFCTDVGCGYPRLEAALSAAAAPAAGPHAAEFAALRDPEALRIAALLRDADLLQSAGLRASDHDRATQAILAERGQSDPLTKPAVAEILFAKVMKGRFLSDAGRFFQPNLDALRALNALRLTGAEYAGADLEALARRFAGPDQSAMLQ